MVYDVATYHAAQTVLELAYGRCILAVPTAPLAERLIVEILDGLEERSIETKVDKRNRRIETPEFTLMVLTDRQEQAGRGQAVDCLFLHHDISEKTRTSLLPCAYLPYADGARLDYA